MKNFFRKIKDTVTRKHCKPHKDKHRDKLTIQNCGGCSAMICANCWSTEMQQNSHVCVSCGPP